MLSKSATFLICVAAFSCLSFKTNAYVTQTVYGFLDFTTTIADTVMVFSPHSAPVLSFENQIEISENSIKTEPVVPGSQNEINPTKHSSYNVASLKGVTFEQTPFLNTSPILKKESSPPLVHKVPSSNTTSYIEDNLSPPEYDFLSRQPVEFAEESFRLISLKSSNETSPNNHNKKPADNPKKLTAKHIHTAHNSVQKHVKPTIRPSSSFRIPKPASPSQTKISHNHSGLSERTTHGTSRLRKNNTNKTVKNDVNDDENKTTPAEKTTTKKGRTRNKSKRRNKSSNKAIQKTETTGRRSLRPINPTSSVETDTSPTFSMLKLNRTPGRWQYKTSPKPRISIRKVLNEAQTTTEPGLLSTGIKNSNTENSSSFVEIGDLDSSGSQNGHVLNNLNPESKQLPFIETLNVELSTPNDLKTVYYEIATIKTPYIFQVGLLKKTRFVTVTSTIEKTIPVEPTETIPNNKPLIENILTSSLNVDPSAIESSITTLSPIHLNNKAGTPSLETVVETFSTTLSKLKTQVLPFIRDDLNQTFYSTLIQTYDITTIIGATKTIAPGEDNHFEASRNFKDFSGVLDEAGSEINLELEFGDTDNSEILGVEKEFVPVSELPGKNEPKDETSANVHNKEEVQKPFEPNIFNLTPKLPTVITTSLPYIVMETVWESHVVPVINGLSTSYRTLSKSIGTVDKTYYRKETSTVLLPSLPVPQISINPYLLHQEFQTITSPIVQATTVQQTNSKVLKLTFGAKTAYTTIYSTLNVPTTLTMFVTTAIPVQPTAAFPGYYPPPFHPYPFVGYSMPEYCANIGQI